MTYVPFRMSTNDQHHSKMAISVRDMIGVLGHDLPVGSEVVATVRNDSLKDGRTTALTLFRRTKNTYYGAAEAKIPGGHPGPYADGMLGEWEYHHDYSIWVHLVREPKGADGPVSVEAFLYNGTIYATAEEASQAHAEDRIRDALRPIVGSWMGVRDVEALIGSLVSDRDRLLDALAGIVR